MRAGSGVILVAALGVAAGPVVCARPAAAWPPPSSEVTELRRGNNAFAWDLYGQLRRESGNLFFSPYSLRTALAMTAEGAKGETAAQMTQALHLTLRGEALHAAVTQTAKGLKPRAKGDYALAVANSLWGQQGYRWLDGFLADVRRGYGGGLHEVDFARATEAARMEINASVEDQTKRRIRDLVPMGGVDPLTRLALVNAIWFKGRWLDEFEKADTEEGPFHVGATETVVAHLMHRRGEGYRYGEAGGVQVLELPYRGERLSMVVLLPQAEGGLGALEARLTPEGAEAWFGSATLVPREVDVYLPRFAITWGTREMRGSLEGLGMRVPFDDDKADFSGMNGVVQPDFGALHIAKVFHKAFVEVNEEGTEATAATAVLMGPRGAPQRPPVFRADRPFVFLIRDTVSGSILFLGRLVKPEA